MLSDDDIARAAEILARGGVVGLPTETVYGLAADARNELAVRKIFAIKGRPSTHPLIVHVHDVESVKAWVKEFPQSAEQLAERFWPGPLTLVLPRSARASDAVTGGQDTVAVRVPCHPVAQAVLKKFGGGVAAPSANRFGGVSPTTAEHVRKDLGDAVELILDGGASEVGLESTIVDLSSSAPAVLRPGVITAEQVSLALGRHVPVKSSSEVRVSGSLDSHYAPKAGVILSTPEQVRKLAQRLRDEGKKVAGISPDSVALPAGIGRFHLPDDPVGYAQKLYATLRAVDEGGFEVAVVVEPAVDGVGVAVHDRLKRAAAPKGKAE